MYLLESRLGAKILPIGVKRSCRVKIITLVQLLTWKTEDFGCCKEIFGFKEIFIKEKYNTIFHYWT